jgi:Leucine-rich repeat (LRR) protein
MSKNKITTLPAYIGDMHDLKILKLDHNPLSFPPAAVLDLDGEETDRDAWLDNLKRFLRNGPR